jgi:hypothetical protein
VIARLAAANPVPAPRRARRRPHVLALVAAALLVPAAYAADRVLGISNEGTSVPTSSVLPGQSQLDQALDDMQVGDTMQLLGTVDGVTIYAARNASGHICLAVDETTKGVLCDLNGFPSATEQVLTFPGRLMGIAADGVASVAFVDDGGNVLDSTPVTNNLFASGTRIGIGVASDVEALDANGNVLSKQKLSGR